MLAKAGLPDLRHTARSLLGLQRIPATVAMNGMEHF